MKYIVEVLQPNESGKRTQVYSNKEAAIAALDGYNYHRPGQPVVALYNGEEGTEALLAIGTGTGRKDYYLLGSNNKTINNYFANISAKNVIVDPIDITLLLAEHGPGYDFDERGIYESFMGAQRHFGWLGTTAAAWATEKRYGNFSTKQLSVQKLFEAILHGNEINRDGVKPEACIEISEDGNTWVKQLVIKYTDPEELSGKTIYVRLSVPNIDELDHTITFNLNPDNQDVENILTYDTFANNQKYIYQQANLETGTTQFEFQVIHGLYGTGYDYAELVVEDDSGEEPEEDIVNTDGAEILDQISTNTYKVCFSGSSNFNPNGSGRIRYREAGETAWNDALNYTSGLYNWKKTVNLIEVGVLYEYQAYAYNDNNELIYGEIKTFIINSQGDIKYKFKYYANIPEAANLSGYINGISAANGSEHTLTGSDSWSIEKTDLDSEKYFFDGCVVTDQHGSRNINDYQGTFDSSTEVVFYYHEIEEDEEPVTQYVSVTLKAVVDTDWDNVKNIGEYANYEGQVVNLIKGQSVNINFTPKPGYNIIGWTETLRGQVTANTTYTNDNIQSNTTVYVIINTTNKFTVYASYEPHVSNLATMYIDGEQASYKLYDKESRTVNVSYVQQNQEYTFKHWKINGQIQSETGNSIDYTIDPNLSTSSANIIAVFESGGEPQPPQPTNVTLTVKSNNTNQGTITPNDYANGVQIEKGTIPSITSFTASANIGYVFDCWKKGNTQISTDTTLTINSPINENTVYTAHFKAIQYTIKFKTDQNGVSFTSPDEIVLNYGTNISFPGDNRLSDNNYTIDYWTEENDTTHINTNTQIATKNVTYVAHLKNNPVEELPQWENYSSDTSWHDMYTTISALKSNAILNTSKGTYSGVWNKGTNQYTDEIMSEDINYYFPMSLSKIYDSNIKIKIPQGKSFDLYEYNSLTGHWEVHNSLFAPNGDNTYSYTQTETVKAIYGIKLK